MSPGAAIPGQELEQYREYLGLLARLHVNPRLHGKIDLSGVIQVTLLEAHQSRSRLRGQAEHQKVAWLRRILVHNLADEIRKLEADRRDVNRERSLEKALEDSSARLEGLLAAEHSSPSQRAMRNEELLCLAEALAALPENQRRAVELHHLKGWPLADIAWDLGLSKPAVAGLLHRGLQNLRLRLGNEP